jgi:hypothetical protein
MLHDTEQEEPMKVKLFVGVVVCLLLAAAIPVSAQSHQVLQGTQVRLTLLNGLSTSVARDGDPFTAVVAEPVYLGGELILPAGAKVNGTVGAIIRPKRFAMIRGGAAMNITFQSIVIDRHEMPVQMSILSITDPAEHANGKVRKDVKVEEGAVLHERRDIKGDVGMVALGTGGGSVVGAVFSHVVRGLTIGLIGSTAYVMTRKGKEVELPAQTGMLVRLDNTISIPSFAAQAGPYVTPRP